MNLNTFTNITKALSDNGRVRALLSLKQGGLCVCQIIGIIKVPRDKMLREYWRQVYLFIG